MHCPDCNKSMLILEYGALELDWCPACRGCWLDEGEMEQLLHGREPAMQCVEWTGGREGSRRCPRCGEKLHVVNLPGGGPDVDACPAACGLWFDQGELRAAIRARLGEGAAAPIVKTLTEMFGAEESPEKE